MRERPVLETSRLVLRPFSELDASPVRELAGDPDVARMTLSIPHPYPEEMARQWIALHAPRWEEGRELVLAIVSREQASVVGAGGLLLEPAHHHAELGYWIGRPFWGRGYATEASRALLGFGFESLELVRIYGRHFACNPASGSVLRKLGMSIEGTWRRHLRRDEIFHDVCCYGLLREEWAGMDHPQRSVSSAGSVQQGRESAP